MSRPLTRVLVADGFDIIRRGLRVLVESQDHLRVVAEASNGLEALELARRTNPNIAILDISLHKMNGLDLAHQLTRICPNIKILIYTHNDHDEVIIDAMLCGVRGLVLKSDPEAKLMEALNALSIGRPYFSDAISDGLLKRFSNGTHGRIGGCLTSRERQVVQLIAEGRLNKQIGYELGISIKTVETHRAAVMHKLSLQTTADVVRFAVRNNIIQA
jgi:DNA-binding NarL/FixJ family response regulator